MRARRAIFIAPFDELSEPGLVAELAVRAEERGWDGFFVWDHIAYREPVSALADPWITLAAIAVRTEKVIIGPLVTPLSRRRPHQLARETATLDRLSGGRLVLGVGLGSDRSGEFDPERFGEEGDARARAVLLDAALDSSSTTGAASSSRGPVQQPRIPIWVAVALAEPPPAGARGALGRRLPDRPARSRSRWPSTSPSSRSRRATRSWSRTRPAPTPPRGRRPVRRGV